MIATHDQDHATVAVVSHPCHQPGLAACTRNRIHSAAIGFSLPGSNVTGRQLLTYNHGTQPIKTQMTGKKSKDEIKLVGRSREIGYVTRALKDLESGDGGVLMFSGEPGIGKSTLARFSAGAAAEFSIPVFWGFSWEAGGAPAYWPWTQLLSSLIDERDLPNEITNQLQQLIPGLGDGIVAAGLRPEQAKFQLLESVRRLLDHVARETPLVLIFEDLHAADSDSLQLLHYVARHANRMRLLIIGTYRDAEARALTAGDPLWRTCRDAQVLELARLNEDEVRDYLTGCGPVDASEEFILNLLETTDGNPLFLAELVVYLGHEESTESGLPQNVQQVIRQQVDRLPEPTIRLIAEAAVLGREFELDSLVSVASRPRTEIKEDLREAINAGLVRKLGNERYRFSHALHRDVLYQDLTELERSSLHLKVSEFLRDEISRGDENRWSEFAAHLGEAGSAHRDEAIEAWRSAANRALDRLAFDDAVSSLNKALAAFGGGPRYSPTDLYKLLLECAGAELLAGATAIGHEHCRTAFEIARTLEDFTLMSEAALTWGGAIVVATVNAELVAALQECLAVIPTGNVALRSRVLARLAGAMQPARNPSQPMEMAREAIALARSTGDKSVLFAVLRSAISALMDFAPASERMPLNEEFARLAGELGDVPSQFRSGLRLMMDACEASEREKMDRAIDDCDNIARRIGLPHYQWRVASARAMQATIDGDFAKAKALLAVAQKHADEIDDLESKVTLPIQQFVILIEWQSPECESLANIEANLKLAYESGMADARFFVEPFINSHKFLPNAEVARQMLGNPTVVERTFSGGDRYSLCRLGEFAVIANEPGMAQKAFDAILPFVDDCGILGLMGTSSAGPVAMSLGNIAAGLQRYEDALAFQRKALKISESMRSPPWVARVHAAIAVIGKMMGDAELAARHGAEADRLMKELGLRPVRVAPAEPASVTAVAGRETIPFSIDRDGELWRVSYNDSSVLLRSSKGIEMLAELTENPEADMHVIELSGGNSVHGQDGGGREIDSKARSEYEGRIRDLREELDEANEFGDTGRAENIQDELDALTREISRAFGLGGRSRQTGNAAERARVNVRRRLKDAISRIAEQHPDAGRYLENTIKTGTYCRYMPM